jgi:hypothetical protein
LPNWSLDRFFYDLIVKATLLLIGIISGDAVVICSLMTLFTADWVLQRRFFNLSVSASNMIGLALFSAAILHYLSSNSTILMPLALFTLVSIVSTYQSIKKISVCTSSCYVEA